MAFYGKSHFGPQNDPKSTILDPKMTQNDPFWPILDPKMTQNRRFWTPKWPFSGFSGFWAKIGYFACKNGHFGHFLDPFLAIFGVIFGPKIEASGSLSLKSLISAPNRRTHGSTMVRTLKIGSKMGVQNGSKIGGQKWVIFGSKFDQKSMLKNGFFKIRFFAIFRIFLFLFFSFFSKNESKEKSS